MSACETVAIKNGDGYTVINASEFDPAVHRKVGDPDPVEFPLDELNAEKSIALIQSVIETNESGEAVKTLLSGWYEHEVAGKNRKSVLASIVFRFSPTLEEFEKAGYKAENYPPQGYVEKPSPRLEQFRTEQAAAKAK